MLFLNIGDQVSIIIYCIIFVQLFFTNLFLFPYFISHSIFFTPCFALSLSTFRSPHFHFKSFEQPFLFGLKSLANKVICDRLNRRCFFYSQILRQFKNLIRIYNAHIESIHIVIISVCLLSSFS